MIRYEMLVVRILSIIHNDPELCNKLMTRLETVQRACAEGQTTCYKYVWAFTVATQKPLSAVLSKYILHKQVLINCLNVKLLKHVGTQVGMLSLRNTYKFQKLL